MPRGARQTKEHHFIVGAFGKRRGDIVILNDTPYFRRKGIAKCKAVILDRYYTINKREEDGVVFKNYMATIRMLTGIREGSQYKFNPSTFRPTLKKMRLPREKVEQL